MKFFILFSGIILFSACTPTKTVEPESSGGAINSSAPYLWSANVFPRNLQISNSFTNAEVTNIQAMTGAWETAVENKKNFFTDTNRTAEVSSPTLDLDGLGDDSVNGIYKIAHWPMELNSGALAVTQIFGRRFNIGSSNEFVRIEHADILINENLYDFRTDDSTSNWSYDLRTVVLHELGHFLGLGHKYGNTVMVPAIGNSSVARAPTGVDTTDIASKYSISLGSGTSSAIVAGPQANYSARKDDPGTQVKIMIELMADGECVHKENGKIISRHSVNR